MAKIKIDDVEYETDDFSRETQAIFNTIRFVENELAHCRNQMALTQLGLSSEQSLWELLQAPQ